MSKGQPDDKDSTRMSRVEAWLKEQSKKYLKLAENVGSLLMVVIKGFGKKAITILAKPEDFEDEVHNALRPYCPI